MSRIIESLLQRAESHFDGMAQLEMQALGMNDLDDDEAKYSSTLAPELLEVDDIAVAQMTEGERFVHNYR